MWSRHGVLLAVVLAAAWPSPAARAEPPAPRAWYGWQLVLADGAALAVMFGGGAAESDLMMITGTAGLVVGAPLIHLAHENRGPAATSAVLRLGLPLIGGFVGSALCSEDGAGDSFLGCAPAAAGGIFTGWVTAMIIDLTLLAYDRPAAAAGERSAGLGVGVAPRAEGGFTVAVGGAF